MAKTLEVVQQQRSRPMFKHIDDVRSTAPRRRHVPLAPQCGPPELTLGAPARTGASLVQEELGMRKRFVERTRQVRHATPYPSAAAGPHWRPRSRPRPCRRLSDAQPHAERDAACAAAEKG